MLIPLSQDQALAVLEVINERLERAKDPEGTHVTRLANVQSKLRAALEREAVGRAVGSRVL